MEQMIRSVYSLNSLIPLTLLISPPVCVSALDPGSDCSTATFVACDSNSTCEGGAICSKLIFLHTVIVANGAAT